MSETPYEAFLGSGIGPLLPGFPGIVFGSRLSRWIYRPGKAYALEPALPVAGWLTLLRPSLGDNASNIVQEY